MVARARGSAVRGAQCFLVIGLTSFKDVIEVLGRPIDQRPKWMLQGRAEWREAVVDVAGHCAVIDPLDDPVALQVAESCLLYTSPSPRDVEESRMPSSA